LSHQNLHSTYASCWGWTSPGGSEFAIIGAGTGTSIVDVSVPTAPVEMAYITGVSSQWREMKTYSHYAYIVSEGTNSGLQIVDLATSPPTLVTTYNATFTTAHSITIVDGYAYVNGARMNGTQVGIRFLNLANRSPRSTSAAGTASIRTIAKCAATRSGRRASTTGCWRSSTSPTRPRRR
jgi:hypothetical protein